MNKFAQASKPKVDYETWILMIVFLIVSLLYLSFEPELVRFEDDSFCMITKQGFRFLCGCLRGGLCEIGD